MMTTKMKLTKHSALRVAGVLPLAAGMMMLFSFTERPAEIVYTPEPETTLTVQLPDMTNVIFWLSNENREMTKKEMDAINPDDIQSIDVLKETASLTPYLEKTGRKSADGVVLITMKSQNSDGGIPLFNAEVMPKFQGGGLTEFRKWVSERLVYPKEAQDGNITGKVTVRFIIEKDGSLTNIEEIASPSKLLTDEVARVLRQSPKWSPGMQGGKPVRIFYILPIDFSLKGATKTAGAPVKIALPEKSEVTIDELYVVAYGADATETTTVTINSAKKDGGSIGVTGTPMDKLFIWLEGENRELTLAQMNAISGDDISKVSVIRNGEYPENITRAMGDRKFEGAVLITLK
jgi:TonB family protein